MRYLAASFADSRVTSTPATRTSPESSGSIPAAIRSSVLFPEPDGP